VSEIARDILEMAVYAKSPSALGQGGLTVGVASLPGAAASYEVTGPVGPADPPFRHRIVLYDHVWAPTNYEALARLAIDRLQLKTSAAPAERPGSVATALVDLTPGTVERENTRVSSRLATDMLSAAAHEEAAFVLGAFALRENAGTFRPRRASMVSTLASYRRHSSAGRARRSTRSPGSAGGGPRPASGPGSWRLPCATPATIASSATPRGPRRSRGSSTSAPSTGARVA
jgi:hypothetical protein